jgi:hypothetical protein
MIRKFTNIICVYYNDKSYIPAKYTCPDFEFDDVILNLSTNTEQNYEKISEFIVDYAFALFCNKSDLSDFVNDHKKYKRENWKLLDFIEKINKPAESKKEKKNESTSN